MPDRVGQQIGNYRLVKLLGKGGFADVYLGQHVLLASKQAAIKVLHMFDVDVQRFQEEAETTEKLVHPHIVRLLDFALQEGTPFLVLDFAPGGALRARHPKGSQVPIDTVVGYLKEITPALQYAHDRNILHRDIKPDNMLIGRQGELLISDFGMAVLSQTGRTSLQASYGIGGTPFYMAPEMFRGKPEKASDQYSLAVVVYEWLCGSVPFSEGGFIQLGYQHTHEPVPPPSEKNPSLSSDVEAVILTALAKDPHQRFGSVRAFANALEQACLPSQKAPPIVEPIPSQSSSAGIPTIQVTPQEEVLSQQPAPSVQAAEPVSEKIASVPPTEPPAQTPVVTQQPRLRDAVSSHTAPAAPSTRANVPPGVAVASSRFTRRKVVGLGLAGAGVIATGVVGWWELAHLSPTFGIPTPIPPGTTLYTYHGHTDIVNAVAWSPDGKYIASGSSDKTVQVWDALTGTRKTDYTGHSSAVFSVAWSPDGKRIASGSSDTTVQVWDASNGGNVFTYRGHSGAVSSVAWSPDGKYIASGCYDKTVQVWYALTGHKVLTYQGHSDVVLAVTWSPDGNHIASGSVDGTAQVWDALTGHKVLTYQGGNPVMAVAWSPDGKRIASIFDLQLNVRVWEALTGKDVLTYLGNSDSVNAVAWSPDGKYIASGGGVPKGYGGTHDNTVHIQNADTGNNTLTYHGHSDDVSAVAWSPDGKRIASGGYDKTVQVWQAP